ncbi:T6SS phospholipase effector Tle1-like catalytic domain-containing protein [Chryseobacterium sp. 'Rf worker isolate 10']|uniref:T6SS phospholipase effector Tle1-like catalytic domain-containing protein n=1 Tax=Chryseobacterium sp. 'Rf worker isolate 10' TaxID=2887348 RepID=UPI003D6FE022
MNGSSVISVGIFFDGTGNNGVNILSPDKPLNNNESYYGTFTNIYKLYSLFIGDEKIYIEGIGTVTGSEDSNFAMATCANPPYGNGYSSDDKLQKVWDFIQDIAHDETKEYNFYIYGFGRGGMLARTLCNQLLNHFSPENCRIKFLGAFDTVESKPFNTYNLNIPVQVENAFHICAVNESRFFFPLTGFFENSKAMQDQKSENQSSVWKEVFVPGDHADIGGGYLEGPQSVYISTDFMNIDDLHNYVSDIRNAKTNAEGNKIWDALLSGYEVETANGLSQAYVRRDKVYNDLSKVYGKLMMEETNEILSVFSTENYAYFGTDYNKHAFLNRFYIKMKEYIKDLSVSKKPIYDFAKLADYTHISANFGLYSHSFRNRSQQEINIEMINNGLNVSSSTSVDQTSQTRLSVELHLPEDSFVADFLYGTSVPNNDIWVRSIIKTPAVITSH